MVLNKAGKDIPECYANQYGVFEPGGFQVKQSAKATILSGSQRQWTLEVPAGGEKALTYSVDFPR